MQAAHNQLRNHLTNLKNHLTRVLELQTVLFMTPSVTKPQRICRHGRDDLVDTVIAPASAEAAASTVSDVREERERVSKYLTRLKEVRHKRSAMEVSDKLVLLL